MRQRRSLELTKDYDITIQYHPGKANVVADALITCQTRLLRDLEEMQVEVRVIDPSNAKYQLNQVFNLIYMTKSKRPNKEMLKYEKL